MMLGKRMQKTVKKLYDLGESRPLFSALVGSLSHPVH